MTFRIPLGCDLAYEERFDPGGALIRNFDQHVLRDRPRRSVGYSERRLICVLYWIPGVPLCSFLTRASSFMAER
jgi:hypothetical protein